MVLRKKAWIFSTYNYENGCIHLGSYKQRIQWQGNLCTLCTRALAAADHADSLARSPRSGAILVVNPPPLHAIAPSAPLHLNRLPLRVLRQQLAAARCTR
jgi:hypothetical protein